MDKKKIKHFVIKLIIGLSIMLFSMWGVSESGYIFHPASYLYGLAAGIAATLFSVSYQEVFESK